MGNGPNSTRFLIESRLAEAARGEPGACFDLGICYSTGTSGVGIDLIEAHKWFNLAAVAGLPAAQDARSDVAGDMTARQIATAQAAARAWLASARPAAA